MPGQTKTLLSLHISGKSHLRTSSRAALRQRAAVSSRFDGLLFLIYLRISDFIPNYFTRVADQLISIIRLLRCAGAPGDHSGPHGFMMALQPPLR